MTWDRSAVRWSKAWTSTPLTGFGVAGRINQGMRTREWYFCTTDVTQMTDVGEIGDLMINSLLLIGVSMKN